ncbi:hypothetical protein ACFQDN_04660 [Pseudomonas asuensis]|uniref:CTP synthase (glutamine hydrolyzing) n=1 Tax=Pseudomonas asuensis TaxID=1825787 RepID=A0ABQ2GT70_9PSED|nr:hypothetical protein [Pseudomonas asuensis]GGM12054.1 hypothetical protein GCM10009425_23820 [Pseudomonas asuensis]
MSASVRDTSTNRQNVRVALIGDYNPNITAHKAIPLALQLAQQSMQVPLAFQWVATADIKETIFEAFDGIWCTPGSPYQSEEGVLSAIQYARLRALPFLGSCAGFQYALIEYARNELNWANAAHAETALASNNPIVSPLECALE